ncbi:Hypothetical predicted protein, partial [Marmota monax]
ASSRHGASSVCGSSDGGGGKGVCSLAPTGSFVLGTESGRSGEEGGRRGEEEPRRTRRLALRGGLPSLRVPRPQ